MTKSRRIAVACQGGGSHTAFTAGVLKQILKQQNIAITALSGTSGGAMCAFLAWFGLLKKDVQVAIDLLEQFWSRIAANSYWEALVNTALVMGKRQIVQVEISPYLVPQWGRETLQQLLQALVEFEAIPGLMKKDSPDLMIGAVDVCSGAFRIFSNQEITPAALLASAAVPTLFRSAPVGEAFYWDGLFAHNPPISELARTKPDEIWVIQINPPSRSEVPRSSEDIRDRRNELAGNLSLEQELAFIDKINQFVDQGLFKNGAYKQITVKKAIMARDLPFASKLDRDPAFIREMIAYGEEQAQSLF